MLGIPQCEAVSTTPWPTGSVADLTVRVASDEELRRRAAEGDEAALAELARRGGVLTKGPRAA